MKKQICVGLAALMLASLFTGCSQANSVEVASVTTEAPKEITYSVPERFTGDWTGLNGTFTVHADAPIELPDVGKLCTADVQRRVFNQEDADKMMAVFLKGNTLYEEVLMTKQSLQAEIDEYEAMLRGEIPYPADGDGSLDRVPSLIEYRKKQMKLVPNEGEKPMADPRFHVEKGWNPDYQYTDTEINGYAEVDGTKIYTLIENKESYGAPRAAFWRDGYGIANGPNTTNREYWSEQGLMEYSITPSFHAEKAQEMGDAIIRELGLDTFTLDHVDPTAFYTIGENYVINDYMVENEDGTYSLAPDTETGYILVYVRNVNGLPLTRTAYSGSASDEKKPAPGSFPYEYIRIIVNQDGMVYFTWDGPYTEPQIRNTNVELLPFEQIQELFGRLLFVKNANWQDINSKNGFDTLHDIHIDKVQLTLMRVRDANTLGPAKIVPVWDFYGTDNWYTNDESAKQYFDSSTPLRYEVQLTINAIDGTLINREIGY